jgi:hypothetical protein
MIGVESPDYLKSRWTKEVFFLMKELRLEMPSSDSFDKVPSSATFLSNRLFQERFRCVRVRF